MKKNSFVTKGICTLLSGVLAAGMCPLFAYADEIAEGSVEGADQTAAAVEETADETTAEDQASQTVVSEEAPEAAADTQEANELSAMTGNEENNEEGTEPTKVALDDSMVSLEYTTTYYNGKVKKPAVTVSNGDTEFVQGTDYTVTYPSAKAAGTYTVTVTAVATSTLCEGSAKATFTIAKATVSAAETAYIVKNKKGKKYTAKYNKECGPIATSTKNTDRDAIVNKCYMSGFGLTNNCTGISGKIKYRALIGKNKSKNWTSWKTSGIAGSKTKNDSVQAIQIQLTGDLGKYYDVYYRVNVYGCDWMGWTKGGTDDSAVAGPAAHNTESADDDYATVLKIRSFQVKLVVKDNAGNSKAPGSTEFSTFSKDEAEDYYQWVLYNKIKNFKSKTKYMISVNTEFNRIAIYKGKKGNWKQIKYAKCGTGKSKAAKATSHFFLYLPGKTGSHFGEIDGHTAWYWTKIYATVRFHSVLYKPYSKTKTTSSEFKQTGRRVSNGCIRLPLKLAKWIKSNAKKGTGTRIS